MKARDYQVLPEVLKSSSVDQKGPSTGHSGLELNGAIQTLQTSVPSAKAWPLIYSHTEDLRALLSESQ
jgi:hypothetical protein